MAATEDRDTLGRARLSFADEADIDQFVSMLSRFESGEVGPDEWRMFRLLRGTYGQRQTGDASMLRIKIPQGILSHAQLNAVADVADHHRPRESRSCRFDAAREIRQRHYGRLRRRRGRTH